MYHIGLALSEIEYRVTTNYRELQVCGNIVSRHYYSDYAGMTVGRLLHCEGLKRISLT